MRSRRLVTLGLLGAHLGCCGVMRPQIAAVEAQQGPAEARTVSGVVINSLTGRPIPRALVQAGEQATLSDGDGRFELSHVTPNSVVFAIKPGYFAENSGATGSLAAASQGDPAADVGPMQLSLAPEAILTGRVTDAHGTPLDGVRVMLRAVRVSSGLKYWEQPAGATTNAEGEFRFAELAAGEYALRTALRLDGPPEGEAAMGYAPVEYPGPGANGAGALQVRAGDQLEADLSTRLERLYRVSGVVIGLPPNSWPSFAVRTAAGSEVAASPQQNPQTGEFRILLPSGSFEFRIQAFVQPQMSPPNGPVVGNSPPLQLGGRQSITVAGGPVDGVRISLEPMAAIGLEVAEEKTGKEQASSPPLPSIHGQMSFSLASAEAQAGPSMYYAEGVNDRAAPGQQAASDGPLLIRNVPPGRYFLQAQGQPWHVASATCGETDLTREPMTVTGSAAGCTIRVLLRDDSASLKVSLSGVKVAQAAFVYLIPVDNRTRDVQVSWAGADGKASLDGIAPGQYLLLASHREAQLAFRDAESLQRYEAEGKRVDLAPGATAQVQLDVFAGEP